MSNLRSIVEQTVHAQLQHLARFQTPIPLFTALLVFSSFPIVGRTSLTSLSALATSLGKLCTSESIPLLNAPFNIFTRAINTAYLRARIHIHLPLQLRHIFHHGSPARPRGEDTYATPRAEATYWRVADRYRRRLYSGNGASFPQPTSVTASRDGVDTTIPLVTYYTPRLLPLYRDRSTSSGKRTSHKADMNAHECRISPKTFCKWHRMVFQDSLCHPTLAQAALQIKYYSNRDLREIQRIARLLPDEHVFDPKGKGARKARGSPRYRDMWQKWLEDKGMDFVIVFE